jgi:hypothetical protein
MKNYEKNLSHFFTKLKFWLSTFCILEFSKMKICGKNSSHFSTWIIEGWKIFVVNFFVFLGVICTCL